ncbi:hypothetical protein NQ314_020522 [Rhamnusium bicolor]|uniref:Uncharacterized protein n=1 Tax=Rhamnusium bicolor TaxID=1586634 RepID=A0AAV8WJW1_9CUCU|nr:hypothetical protein NQ314_020522 [Rhamnusium bicolor]
MHSTSNAHKYTTSKVKSQNLVIKVSCEPTNPLLTRPLFSCSHRLAKIIEALLTLGQPVSSFKSLNIFKNFCFDLSMFLNFGATFLARTNSTITSSTIMQATKLIRAIMTMAYLPS